MVILSQSSCPVENKHKQVGFLQKPNLAFTTYRDNNFQSFVCQMCPMLMKDIWSCWTVLMAWLKLTIWRHWQFHLALLNRITWRYWTVSPGVTGPYHLTLLDSFTCNYWTYWTVSPCVTETCHLTLQDSNRAVQYATTNSLICDCFLKWSQSTWQISQWHQDQDSLLVKRRNNNHSPGTITQ